MQWTPALPVTAAHSIPRYGPVAATHVAVVAVAQSGEDHIKPLFKQET